MKQKKGQFFILAAVILVSLLAGIFLYKNQVFLQESGSIESLKQEVAGETGTVIDYGLYNNQDKLENFIEQMSGNLLTRSSPNLIFFYGGSTELKILNLGNETIYYNINDDARSCNAIPRELSGDVGLGGFGVGLSISLSDFEERNLICTVDINSLASLSFTINEISYEIPLESGKNFYFVIKQEVGEDIHVATSN